MSSLAGGPQSCTVLSAKRGRNRQQPSDRSQSWFQLRVRFLKPGFRRLSDSDSFVDFTAWYGHVDCNLKIGDAAPGNGDTCAAPNRFWDEFLNGGADSCVFRLCVLDLYVQDLGIRVRHRALQIAAAKQPTDSVMCILGGMAEQADNQLNTRIGTRQYLSLGRTAVGWVCR